MLRNREQRQEYADRILSLRGKKASAIFFIVRFIAPAVSIALPAIIHMRSSNLSTLNGSLELYAFSAAFMVAASAICKRVKAIDMEEDRKIIGDYLMRLPGSIGRLVYLTVFSLFISIPIVWSVAIMNRAFDGSAPKELMGKMITKNVRETIFIGTTYLLDIQPDAPEFKGFRFKVASTVYTQVREGDNVVIEIRDGALGHSYVAGVRPMETANKTGEVLYETTR